MRNLSVSAAWDETKAILARDGRLMVSVALALIVLPQILLAVVGVPIGLEATALSRVVYIAVILLGLVAVVALNRLAIGPSVTVGSAISQGLVRLVPLFIVILTVSFLVAIVAAAVILALGAVHLMSMPAAGQSPPALLILLLLVLSSLCLAIFQLLFPIAAVETGNPIRLLTRSWQLARGHYWRLLGFVAIVFIGLFLVGLATQVGVGTVVMLLLGRPNPGSLSALVLGAFAGLIQAAFSVVTSVMLARIYLQLAGKSRPESSWG